MNTLKESKKLYAQLSPAQAAALSFEAAVAHRYEEMSAVADSQPRVHLISSPIGFSKRTIGLYQISLFFGLLYWRNLAGLMRMSYQYKPIEKQKKQCQLLGSIEAALIETCAELHVSVESVKTCCMCPLENDYLSYATPGLTAEYFEIFTNLAR